MTKKTVSVRDLASELEQEILHLAEEYHELGMTVDEILYAVRVAMTALVRLEEGAVN